MNDLPLSNRRSVLVSVAVGIVYTVGTILFGLFIVEYELISQNRTLTILWTLVGLTILGSVPVYLFLQHDLISPALVWLLELSLVIRAELQPTVDGPLGLHFVAWFIVLVAVLMFAAVEYGVRELVF